MSQASGENEKPTPAHFFETYKLAVEMADRVSARRASANSFFFALQAGIAVALGAFALNAGSAEEPEPDRLVLALAAVGGVVIALSWWLLLRSYRDLNTAKFSVIRKIEREHLDIALFSDEWEELKEASGKRWRRRYVEQGAVERVVPLLFVVIYGVLAIRVVFC